MGDVLWQQAIKYHQLTKPKAPKKCHKHRVLPKAVGLPSFHPSIPFCSSRFHPRPWRFCGGWPTTAFKNHRSKEKTPPPRSNCTCSNRSEPIANWLQPAECAAELSLRSSWGPHGVLDSWRYIYIYTFSAEGPWIKSWNFIFHMKYVINPQ